VQVSTVSPPRASHAALSIWILLPSLILLLSTGVHNICSVTWANKSLHEHPGSFFLLVGWDWVHLVLRPLFGLLYQPQMIHDECGAIDGMRIGRGDRSTQRKPAPVPLCPPQIPHDLTWARTRVAAVGNQRLTAWAMALPTPRLVGTAHALDNFQVRKRCSGHRLLVPTYFFSFMVSNVSEENIAFVFRAEGS
jgi:hypothetical protein